MVAICNTWSLSSSSLLWTSGDATSNQKELTSFEIQNSDINSGFPAIGI